METVKHEKPGQVIDFEMSYVQAWKGFEKINKPTKFWKSRGNNLHVYLPYVVQLRSVEIIPMFF